MLFKRRFGTLLADWICLAGGVKGGVYDGMDEVSPLNKSAAEAFHTAQPLSSTNLVFMYQSDLYKQ